MVEPVAAPIKVRLVTPLAIDAANDLPGCPPEVEPALTLASEQALALEVAAVYIREGGTDPSRAAWFAGAAKQVGASWLPAGSSIVIDLIGLKKDQWQQALGSIGKSLFTSHDGEFVAVNDNVQRCGAVGSSLRTLAHVYGVSAVRSDPSPWSRELVSLDRSRVLGAVAERLARSRSQPVGEEAADVAIVPTSDLDLFIRVNPGRELEPSAPLAEVLRSGHRSGEPFSLCSKHLEKSGALALAHRLRTLIRERTGVHLAGVAGAAQRATTVDRNIALIQEAIAAGGPPAGKSDHREARDLYRLAAAAWLCEMGADELDGLLKQDDQRHWIKLLAAHAPDWTSSDDQSPHADDTLQTRGAPIAEIATASSNSLKADVDAANPCTEPIALVAVQRLLATLRIATAMLSRTTGEEHLVIPYRSPATRELIVEVWPRSDSVEKRVHTQITYALGHGGPRPEKRHDLGQAFEATGLTWYGGNNG